MIILKKNIFIFFVKYFFSKIVDMVKNLKKLVPQILNKFWKVCEEIFLRTLFGKNVLLLPAAWQKQQTIACVTCLTRDEEKQHIDVVDDTLWSRNVVGL